MEKVIVSKEVADYFEELILILQKEEYFGFQDSAIAYVDKIIDFIYNSISVVPKKTLPKELKKYGEFYLTFKMNHSTSWYIFYEFNSAKNIYLINAILNNHLKEIKFLNL